jgi:hypothetical protein
VARCLAIDPDSRPASFREILDTLRSVEPPDRWSQDEARFWWTSHHDEVARFIQATS